MTLGKIWSCMTVVYLIQMQHEIVIAQLVKPIFEWVNLEFYYASFEARHNAITSGEFIEGSPRISDVDVYYTDHKTRKVFVTIPRSVNGVPATLGTVTNETYNGNPIVAPYPSWEWHGNLNSCPNNRIVSVFRIHIDECKRLWIIDSGFTLSKKCRPQLLAFDLTTDELVLRYEIPSDQLQSNSVLAGVIADVRTCVNTFVYLADTRSFAIIVYDVNRNTSWRIAHRSMFAVPDYGMLCIEGSQFELMDGLQSVTLSPSVKNKDRLLFYHALASNTEHWLWTSKIQSSTNASHASNFHLYCGRRDTQSSVMAIAKTGVAFFGLAAATSLNCWNTANSYGKQFIFEVYRNRVTLQHISGLKIITNGNGKEELWFANTRAARVENGPIDDGIVNFRIQSGFVEDLLEDSKCNQIYESSFTNTGSCNSDGLPCLKCFNNTVID